MLKHDLDEMQLQKRNRIGTSAFVLLVYLLTIDIVLYGLGLNPLKYPVNLSIVLLVSASYFISRSIWVGAFIGPKNVGSSSSKKTIILTVIAVFIATLSIFVSKKSLLQIHLLDENVASSFILLAVFIASIAVPIIISIIFSRRNNSSDED